MLDFLRPSPSGGLVQLDRLDLRLVSVLSRDSSMTNARLADEIGLSPSACLKRVRRLEQLRIVRRYAADIDWRRICAPVQVLAHVKLRYHRSHDFQHFENFIAGCDNVQLCLSLCGGSDYAVLFLCAEAEDYSDLANRMLETGAAVETVTSYLVMKEIRVDAGALARTPLGLADRPGLATATVTA